MEYKFIIIDSDLGDYDGVPDDVWVVAEVQAGDRPGAIICAYVRPDGEVVFDDHIMWRVSHDLYRMGIDPDSADGLSLLRQWEVVARDAGLELLDEATWTRKTLRDAIPDVSVSVCGRDAVGVVVSELRANMLLIGHRRSVMWTVGTKGVGDITFADSSENNGDALREFAENTVLALSDCIADVHIVDGRQGKSS